MCCNNCPSKGCKARHPYLTFTLTLTSTLAFTLTFTLTLTHTTHFL
tara:strand:- start:401 stop:538 length:138 start_codon:yes stop_codon:yes gene_type:complete